MGKHIKVKAATKWPKTCSKCGRQIHDARDLDHYDGGGPDDSPVCITCGKSK